MNFPTRKLLYTCLQVLLVVILFNFPVIGTIRVRCLDKERFALLKIKAGLKDINGGSLSKWGTKEDKMDCCIWDGVQCDNKTNHVVGLDISDADFNGSTIPEFMGSLGKLQYLCISGCNIGGSIPSHLGNLSMLRHLDLHGSLLNITDLDWLSSLHSLEYLDLSLVDLSRATKWLQVIINLPSLNHLNLWSCGLSATLPPSLPLINTSTSLSFIDLSSNSISTTSILAHFLNVSRCFTDIDFSDNDIMMGKIPDALGNLTFLSILNLSENRLEGGVPTALWNSTMLEYVDLGDNLLHGSLPNVLNLHNLEVLDLVTNGFFGSVPDLTWCKSLRVVDLGENKFNGTLTKSIGSLSKLELLYLSSNNLRGMISEVHLFNLSRLRTLDLSSNSNLTIKIKSHWNPPFKLDTMVLAYCNLGPKFPEWILKAHSVSARVDISNAHISDTIEERLWNSSICFRYLNMSYNQIYGMPPDLSCESFDVVDLSSNEFSGTLPLLGQNLNFLNLARNKLSGTLTNTYEAKQLRFLDLSNNQLSGTLMNTCEARSVMILDLSNNQLSGILPPHECLKNFTNLAYLNLANNFFSGEIPKSLGYLKALSSLHLRNNNFRGKFPTALRHCGQMHVLDLGENNFSGNIPIWIGTSLSNLAVLSLTSNEFYGGLPSTLCHLQNLQTLDLSLNKISGTIPKCIGNFSSMTSKPEPNQSLDDLSDAFSMNIAFGSTVYDTIQITWKDNKVEYKRNLALLKAIDLSSNKLVGQIPPQVTSLHGLFALNISRNNLSGSIPPSIGRLELLNSLDLSENHLSGRIPDTLSQLSHLGVLNLSFNNLSGRIPWNTHMQTFDSTSYIGNSQLCGGPLSMTCPEDETHKNSNSTRNIVDTVDDGEIITTGFYISMTLGFIFGFWGVLGTLFLNKSCRHAWFKMLIHVNDWFCVKIAIYRNRM